MKFKIPVEYKLWGLIDIEANSLEEAYLYAKENIGELELPDRPEYIEDSYVIAADNIDEITIHNN